MDPGHARRSRTTGSAVVLALTLASGACTPLRHDARLPDRSRPREFLTRVVLHGSTLDLHVATPGAPASRGALVVYASGDGGWFGAAVGMFTTIAARGFVTVGFSARTFLRIERPAGAALDPAQLAADYASILTQARTATGLATTVPAILTGWSRGAAFAVLAGSEPMLRPQVRGVIGIGLGAGEDLAPDGSDDDTPGAGDGQRGTRPWPFEPYARLRDLDPLPCAVIQATHDDYLSADRARALFGPDTARRRFYAVTARNHRFSGGAPAFAAALADALTWIDEFPPATL